MGGAGGAEGTYAINIWTATIRSKAPMREMHFKSVSVKTKTDGSRAACSGPIRRQQLFPPVLILW